MEQRYLHEWLKVNYKKLNKHWSKPPRLLGENERPGCTTTAVSHARSADGLAHGEVHRG